MTVLVRGDNVFGTTVSKSFAKKDEKGFPIDGVDTVNISIASYRVVEVSRSEEAGSRSWHQGCFAKVRRFRGKVLERRISLVVSVLVFSQKLTASTLSFW